VRPNKFQALFLFFFLFLFSSFLRIEEAVKDS
jgi:hypothetical protein